MPDEPDDQSLTEHAAGAAGRSVARQGLVPIGDLDGVRERLMTKLEALEEIQRGLMRSWQHVATEVEECRVLLGPLAADRKRLTLHGLKVAGTRASVDVARALVRVLRMNGPSTSTELKEWVTSAARACGLNAAESTVTKVLKERDDLFTRMESGLWALKEQANAIEQHIADGLDPLGSAAQVRRSSRGPLGRAGAVAPDPQGAHGHRLEPGGGVPGPG